MQYERVIAAQEKILEADHPHTLVTVGNLAILLSEMGDHAAAKKLFDLVIAKIERGFSSVKIITALHQ